VVKAIDYMRPPQIENAIEELEDEEIDDGGAAVLADDAGDMFCPPPAEGDPAPPPIGDMFRPEGSQWRAKSGHMMTMVNGRPTRVVRSSKPPHIWPELWQTHDGPTRKKVSAEYWKSVKGPASTASSSAALAAPSVEQTMSHKIIEVCCRPDSLLGSYKYTSRGAVVFRVDECLDFAASYGLNECLNFVDENPGCDAHFSIPCTAGCSWWYVNKSKGIGLEKLEIHIEKFRALIKNVVVLARAVIAAGGDISFEWPASCTLWEDQEVKDMISEFGLKKARCDGCALGVVAQRASVRGRPMQKAWEIATTSDSVYEEISAHRCSGPECKANHVRADRGE
jgi:hypothetical protein